MKKIRLSERRFSSEKNLNFLVSFWLQDSNYDCLSLANHVKTREKDVSKLLEDMKISRTNRMPTENSSTRLPIKLIFGKKKTIYHN